MKLSPPQKRALKFLAKEPWIYTEWGGRPLSGWSPEMKAHTFYSLGKHGLAKRRALDWPKVEISITDEGRKVLAAEKNRP